MNNEPIHKIVMNAKAPIIFIGMHRSGTSMLGRFLESIGLFMGTKKDTNNESFFFQQLNTWLMDQCGARWDMPGATSYIWENEELLNWTEDYFKYLLESSRAIQFLGFQRYLTTGGITQINLPWGWKDPRNTFTLPIWLRIFPEAKVIYIERHGVDVAQSLRIRMKKGFLNTTKKYRRYRPILPFRPKRGGFVESPRCASLEGAFSLWQEYTAQAARIIQQLPTHQVLSLRYEDVLANPAQYFKASAEFCGIEPSNQKIATLIKDINTGRAFSYLKNEELKDFTRIHQDALTEKGYN